MISLPLAILLLVLGTLAILALMPTVMWALHHALGEKLSLRESYAILFSPSSYKL